MLVGLLGLASLAAALIGFGWTLDGHFIGDDFAYVSRYLHFPLAEWPHLFTTGWSEGLWDPPVRELRPLSALGYIVDGDLWGVRASGYRLSNLIVHSLNGTLVGLLAWRASSHDRACALMSALFFVLHPAQAEPVAWIAGRTDVFSTFFMLAAFGAFLRYRVESGTVWFLTTLLLQAAAVFTKESGLTTVALFLAADLLWLRPARWKELRVWGPYAGSLLVLLLYFVCRRAAFANRGIGESESAIDLLHFESYARFARQQVGNLASLVPPFDAFVQDWRFGVHREISWWLFRLPVAAGILCGVVTAVRGWWKNPLSPEDRRAGIYFGLAWYSVITLPLIVTYFSPRHLYAAVAGVAIFLTLVMRSALRTRRSRIIGGVVACSLCLAFLCERLRPWHDSAVVSERVAVELARLDRESPRGAIILDVPFMVERAYCWAWAVPYALRPPFASTKLDAARPMLAAPGLLARQDEWLSPRTLGELENVDEPGWLVQTTPIGSVRITALPPEKLRAAARRLAPSAVSQPTSAVWHQFVSELAQ